MTRLHNVTGELHAEPPWTSGDRQVQCLQAVIANNAIGVHASESRHVLLWKNVVII